MSITIEVDEAVLRKAEDARKFTSPIRRPDWCIRDRPNAASAQNSSPADLSDADVQGRMICMRTTLNLDDELLDAAQEATGEAEKTKVIHLGLQALVRQKAAERLAALGGSAPKATPAPRRREWQRRRK